MCLVTVAKSIADTGKWAGVKELSILVFVVQKKLVLVNIYYI